MNNLLYTPQKGFCKNSWKKHEEANYTNHKHGNRNGSSGRGCGCEPPFFFCKIYVIHCWAPSFTLPSPQNMSKRIGYMGLANIFVYIYKWEFEGGLHFLSGGTITSNLNGSSCTTNFEELFVYNFNYCIHVNLTFINKC